MNLKITRAEQLELENVQLRLLNVQRDMDTLQNVRLAAQRAIFKRLRIPWDQSHEWLVDFQSGTLVRKAKPPAIAQTETQKLAIIKAAKKKTIAKKVGSKAQQKVKRKSKQKQKTKSTRRG